MIKEGVAGYLYSQCPDLETRLPGQDDHVQGSRDLQSHDLRNTRSCDF